MRHTLLVLLALFGWTAVVPGADWSFWRGPEQNGVSRERDLPEKWSLTGKGEDSNLVFSVKFGSLATPIVQNGQVYLLGKVGQGVTQQERAMAFDAVSGAKVWEHRYNVWHTDIVDDRLAFTNMAGDAETGYVYAHATAGQFTCFDKQGKVIWERSLTEEFGRVSGYGGRITTPIVDEDKVIVSMANGSWGEQTIGMIRFVAFDKRTGQVIWWGSGNHRVKDTYYSVPVVAVIGGQRLLLSGAGDGCIHAFKVRTGEKVWSYKFEDGGGAINCSPVVRGNKVWIGHGEENVGNGTQGRLICLDAGEVKDGAPKLLWKHDGVKVKFASPVLHEGLLYVCDEAGKLYCFDADKGGEPLWEFAYGKNTKGSPVLADGKIYISEVDSKFHILKPSREGCERLSQVRFRAVEGVQVELHGSPAVANGKVYFTTTQHLVCIGKKDGKPSADKLPATVGEEAPKAGGKAAHLQVVPADVTLAPGETATFTAIAYDANGRKIGETKVNWAKAGQLPPVFPIGVPAPKAAGKPTPPPPIAGELNVADGATARFTAAKLPNGQFGRVVATVNGLTGHARIRVAPVLPYVMDFEKVPETRTPGAWVNTAGKFAVARVSGNLVLRKRNDNASPLIARANAYIGAPNLKDYTITADVAGTKVRNIDMPEIGIGACRYSLVLIGNDQELRLVSWDAQKRIDKKMPFKWSPDTWYTMKLKASVQGGKGIIQGKVWPAGDKEPAAWTLEVEDPIPNTEGAPLLYGFANGTRDAETPGAIVYYDNVKITPNSK